MPVGSYYPNWRHATTDEIKKTFIDNVFAGILFDVENCQFWFPSWPDRPEHLEDALQVAREQLQQVPKPIPVGDRLYRKFIPATPTDAGNPVFSIHQTDALHAGRDLGDFLAWFSRPQEMFDEDDDDPTPVYSADYREVSFWTDLVRINVGEK